MFILACVGIVFIVTDLILYSKFGVQYLLHSGDQSWQAESSCPWSGYYVAYKITEK